MRMQRRGAALVAALGISALAAPAALAASANVAALQVALRARGSTRATIDGVDGAGHARRRCGASRPAGGLGDRRGRRPGDAPCARPSRAPALGQPRDDRRRPRLGRRRAAVPARAPRLPRRTVRRRLRAAHRRCRCGASRPGPGWAPTASPARARWRRCAGRRRARSCASPRRSPAASATATGRATTASTAASTSPCRAARASTPPAAAA